MEQVFTTAMLDASTSPFRLLPADMAANFDYNASSSSTLGPTVSTTTRTTTTTMWGMHGNEADVASDPAFGIALACLTIPVVLVGLLANSMVLYIVLRFKNMHNVINYSFANLALADFLGLLFDAVPAIVLTLKTHSITDAGCRFLLYFPWTIRQAACLTLAYLAFDRYRLIIHPTSSVKSRSPSHVLAALAVTWIVSFIIQLPTVFLTGIDAEGLCLEYRPSRGGTWYYWLKFVTIYAIPLAVISVSYFKIWQRLSTPVGSNTRSASVKTRTFRKRSARRILIIVIFFAVTWVPVFIVHMWPHYDASVTENTPRYGYVHRLSNFVLYVSMMLNPALYAFAGDGFRKHFRRFAGPNIASSTDLDRERTPDVQAMMEGSTLRKAKK